MNRADPLHFPLHCNIIQQPGSDSLVWSLGAGTHPRERKPRPMNRFFATIVASALFGVAFAMPNMPTAEAADSGGILVNYTSNQGISVCKDWGNTSCASASPRCWLNPGEDSKSKCGWSDTDGYYLSTGWRGCEVRPLPTNYFPAGSCLTSSTGGPRWVKVSATGKKWIKVWWVG